MPHIYTRIYIDHYAEQLVLLTWSRGAFPTHEPWERSTPLTSTAPYEYKARLDLHQRSHQLRWPIDFDYDQQPPF